MKLTALSVLAGLMIGALSACSSLGGSKAESVEPVKTSKTMRATGYSRFDNGNVSTNQRWLMAQQAAKLDAYRGLADQLYKEVLDGQKTVGSQVMSDDIHRMYLDTYMRSAKPVDYRTVRDTLQASLELNVTPRFYRCMAGDAAVVNQCLQEDNKLPFTRTGNKPAIITSVNMACDNPDCSDQLHVQGFSRERHAVDNALLDLGLYDTEWMVQTGVNLFLINGVVLGF
ncbi:MAG: hypothetical protein ACXV7J_02670 [Methylomonas sp.]